MINIFERLFLENELIDAKAIKFPFKSENEKTIKKLNNAINKYANGVALEDVVFLHDSSLLGNAKNGFLLTPTHLYTKTIANKAIALSDISYIKKGKVYDYNRKKLASLEPFFDEKEAQYAFEDILNLYIKINSIIEPFLEKGVDTDMLIDNAFEHIDKNKAADNLSFYKHLQDKGLEVKIEKNEIQDSQKELTKPRFNFILKLLGVENGTFLDGLDKYVKYFIYALTPLYLVMIYYKTVEGADLNSLIIISFVIFSIYQPVAMMIKQKDLEFSFHALTEDKEIIQYFRYVFLFYVSLFIPVANLIVPLIAWWFLSRKIYDLAKEAEKKDSYKVYALYFTIVALQAAIYLSSASAFSGVNYVSALFNSFFSIIFFAMILMPPLAMTILGTLFSGLFSGLFGMGKKALSIGFSMEKIIGVLLGGYLFMAIFVGTISAFINAFDSYTVAFISTSAMIFISGFGAIFQIKLLVSTFKDNSKEIKKLTIISVAVFYAIMVVNMNIVSTVKTLSHSIKTKQESIFNFSKKYDKYN